MHVLGWFTVQAAGNLTDGIHVSGLCCFDHMIGDCRKTLIDCTHLIFAVGEARECAPEGRFPLSPLCIVFVPKCGHA